MIRVIQTNSISAPVEELEDPAAVRRFYLDREIERHTQAREKIANLALVDSLARIEWRLRGQAVSELTAARKRL